MVEVNKVADIPCARITASQLHMYFIPDLKDKLLKAISDEPNFLIIDLSQVEYLDSSAMGVLFQVQKKMQHYGGALFLVGINSTIEIVFRLTKSDQHFTIYETVEDVIKKINK
ncbi:MAG TPA: STAS domain-containing protein [Turneriella sp.]|nr:STAS domain-containing protein [Turneriella sp.]